MTTTLTAVPEAKHNSKSLRDYWMNKVVPDGEPASVTLESPLAQGPVVRDGMFELEIPSSVGRTVDKISGGSSFLAYATFLAATKACVFRHTGKTVVVTGSTDASPIRRR